MDSQLASRAARCLQLFGRFLEHPENLLEDKYQLQMTDLLGRYKLWAGNIGAFHPNTMKTSIDIRLRENVRVSKRISDLLDELAESLEEGESTKNTFKSRCRYHAHTSIACSIASGESKNRTAEALSDDGDDYQHDEVDDELSEINEIVRAIDDVIHNLFRFSATIQQSSGRDMYAKASAAATIRFPVDETFDINHVYQKFPALKSAAKEWLATRLGKAITQRRMYLWYCREHRSKTAADPQGEDPQSETLGVRASQLNNSFNFPSSLAKPTSTKADTQASTLMPTNDAIIEDHLVEETRSQTSYATSTGQDPDHKRLHVAHIDSICQKAPFFECPYCWQTQTRKSQKYWKKHVWSDIRPYVCTFDDCEAGLFPDHDSWFSHELKEHRRNWKCTFCSLQSLTFESATQYEEHLRCEHESRLGEDAAAHLPTILDMSQQSLSTKIPPECPLCNDWEQALRESNPQLLPGEQFCVTPEQYVKHVGAHMEQLALFAIPRGCTDEQNSNSNNSQKVLQPSDGDRPTILDWRSKSSQIWSDRESLVQSTNPLSDASSPSWLPSWSKDLIHGKSPICVETYGLGSGNARQTGYSGSDASTASISDQIRAKAGQKEES
ncbi:hypothetical protein GLAREA_01430 [Glarea lozoyensis ATCC 20868]|uniref:C2H2-type domain-containing protein n=1 Tax=Glarea lozoyensis (strain ATCC 20868 / MF5171) TaxID=1116229 RepID=S3DFU4_GLAL2|nr:uncharacterized protein GLAREA_01430 [Glarea lozoyensis ATCC 20868]EPE25518.1 hypothetical protein GLAREA_01430 [Glarea lozoyensis ATCC 20868]